jgi:hypothetical protein
MPPQTENGRRVASPPSVFKRQLERTQAVRSFDRDKPLRRGRVSFPMPSMLITRMQVIQKTEIYAFVSHGSAVRSVLHFQDAKIC